MTYDPQGQSFSESNLDSPEYRERLLRKLNCLIAVLEVATAKVRRTIDAPGADVDRLNKIRRNLQDTLDVCLRAKSALEKRGKLPEGIAGELSQVVNPEALKPNELERAEAQRAAAKSKREFSRDEAEKFGRMGPIEKGAVQACDIDELSRLLQS
ncbi:MAG: hypothetical protein IT453_21120 [Planctomycetes bacterium]|nr:hypothetical protein [Planctomycetota bacterium]